MKTIRFALVLTLPSLALAQTADFDVATEGVVGPLYTENGLEFSDLDRYTGGSNESFSIDDASTTLAGVPEFTPPNVLGFGTFVVGGGSRPTDAAAPS